MRRTLIVLLVAAATTVGLTASAGASATTTGNANTAANAASATQPILGPKAFPYYGFDHLKGTIGFGHVKPRKIFFGGDPTGLVCRIDWHGWGNRTARGIGVGWYVGRNQDVAQGHAAVAHVVVSKLGRWKGRPAYNKLTWSFPHHGRDRAAVCHA